MSWIVLRIKLSEVLGCPTHALPSFGYIPSWSIKSRGKIMPKILDNEASFEKLIKEADEYVQEQKAKNRGKGVVKAWSIHLVDLYKAEREAKVRHTTTIMVLLQYQDLLQPSAKAKASAATPKPIDEAENQEYQLIEKIKDANKCNLHQHVCIVANNGDHVTPTAEDYALWAYLCVCF
jgi:hypothetical protein